ncbi:MAG: TIM barrel protein [Candidatus Doudnabacteria bacterium]|nr:TIM barrel protein [Candidatus Doudnabacteria bacterium]
MIRRLRSGALWTVKYQGADPFGGPVLKPMSVLKAMSILAWAKTSGYIDLFSAHDDDLLGWDPDDPEDYKNPKHPIHEELRAIKAVMDKAGLKMHMITCSLHGHPMFTAGGFTNRDAAIRVLAIKKALRCAWIGNFLGAEFITYWVARDGFESVVCVPSRRDNSPLEWLRQALNIISASCKANRYTIKHGTIEPKCNEPRGAMYIALVGAALALIATLDDPDFWGVNPEIPQHSAMGNQHPFLEVMHATDQKKLFFLHIGGQIPGQFDDDFPTLVGEGQETMVLIFKYLDEIGWNGVIEFDCHALRSDLGYGLSEEEVEEIFKQFLAFNSLMYTLIEQVLVPRLMNNAMLAMALDDLDRPQHSPPERLEKYAALLADPDPENIAVLLATKVSVGGIQRWRQDHLMVEFALKLALYGVDAADLELLATTPGLLVGRDGK